MVDALKETRVLKKALELVLKQALEVLKKAPEPVLKKALESILKQAPKTKEQTEIKMADRAVKSKD